MLPHKLPELRTHEQVERDDLRVQLYANQCVLGLAGLGVPVSLLFLIMSIGSKSDSSMTVKAILAMFALCLCSTVFVLALSYLNSIKSKLTALGRVPYRVSVKNRFPALYDLRFDIHWSVYESILMKMLKRGYDLEDLY